jgi:hypothetical protein
VTRDQHGSFKIRVTGTGPAAARPPPAPGPTRSPAQLTGPGCRGGQPASLSDSPADSGRLKPATGRPSSDTGTFHDSMIPEPQAETSHGNH